MLEPNETPFARLSADSSVLDATPSELARLEHLLKVADAVTLDAAKVWTELWSEFRQCTTGNRMITPDAQKGFVPACGWPEFLEKFFLLKHYLDSTRRVCQKSH